ncbi:MAG: hypothetical protein HKN49_10535, partial [Gammaproteobacteria bacterium]|nr:hypothetical protein [Gammaproteobacteria bacterium]
MQVHNLLLFLVLSLGINVTAAETAPDMDPTQADAILEKYINANERRGGLCLIGFNPGATLDYDQPFSVDDAKIEFTGRFGKPHLFGKAFIGGEIEVKVEAKLTVVDTRQLKKIRILDKRVQNLRNWCPNVQPQYLVVLYPIESLPSDAEISINVQSREELNELMAA